MNPGARVNHYILTKRLGKGGQGSVWEAFPVEGSTAPRALKLIDLRGIESDKAERAWREAQALHDITHPGLVPCREFFRDADTGLMGLVFDLVPGQTLSAAARDPRMTTETKLDILDQLAAILAHVHALGIVHRDLKPDNVLITDDFWSAPRMLGGVKLVDFGISARAGNPTPVTNPGSVVGTIPYLPPDVVCSGRWSIDRDGFARDVFAFGVMGWELLFGAHPTGLSRDALFPAYADAYQDAHMQRRPWPPASPDNRWMVAIRACLTLDPQRRPTHGSAILDILREGHFLPSLSTITHTGPTSAHERRSAPSMPATAVDAPWPQTEAMRGPPMTPSLPRYTASNVPAPPSRRTNQEPASSMRWLGFVLAAALGAFGLWVFAFPKGDATSTSTTIPFPTTNSLPMQPENSFEPVVTRAPQPCCHERQTCPSERACTPDPCSDVALPSRTWSLRMTGAKETLGQRDLASTHPRATICMRNDRTSQTVCAPMSSIVVEGGDRVHVVPATTNDLAYGRITIWVDENGMKLLPPTKIADNRGGIKASVLCGGMLLRVGDHDTAPLHVFVFLD